MEEWRQIQKHPNYDASSEGRIRNRKTGRILKTRINDRGYESVCLHDRGEQTSTRVHRLIAETFIDENCEGLDVNHIDGNKTNNHIDNLEFCTRKENVQHAFKNGLNHGTRKKPVRIIETGEEFDSVNECAIAIGADRTQVVQCLHGRCGTCRGYHFEFI